MKKPHSTQPVSNFAPAEKWYKAMDQVNSLTSTDCDTAFITNRHEDSTNDDTCDDRNNSRARSPTKSERKFYIESLLVNRTSSQSGDACSSYQPLPAMPASSVRPYPKSKKMKRKSVSDPPATEYVDSHSSQFDNPDMSSNGLLGLEDSGGGGGGGSSCKRARTIFTADQLEKMEQEFHKQQYVVGHERMYLANALNLTEAQVKVWFQNRRIKWRKQHMISEQNKLFTIADSNEEGPQVSGSDPCPSHQLDHGN